MTIAETFDEHYVVDPITGCWVWTRGKIPDGYGTIALRGTHILAHRFSYEKYVGPVPPKMLVCHTCDNPPCVNPKHLFLGSHLANKQDSVRKGRASGGRVGRGLPGEKNYNAKLRNVDVERIRDMLCMGCSQRSVAAYIGSPAVTINHIARGRTWRVLPE